MNVTVNGYAYRSTIAPMGGRYLIPFSSDTSVEGAKTDATRERRIAKAVAELTP
ncbi:hypothetical protein [Streptomyces cyaneofuscatus]|uniref:hypothetical protein n=1 Tax=Streptomyces cyaneofuscatus TaxID=66883 RepID=UPI00378A8314